MIVSLPVFALQVGTGGAATIDYIKQRGARGYAFAPYVLPRREDVTAERSPIENLVHIRDVLGLTVTDLSKALGVSRQAIYDWQSGKPIAENNANRLADFAFACDLIAFEGIKELANLVRRPIYRGKTLFEIISEGGSAESAARALVEIARKEAHQRRRLEARFSKRTRATREMYGDLGAPRRGPEAAPLAPQGSRRGGVSLPSRRASRRSSASGAAGPGRGRPARRRARALEYRLDRVSRFRADNA